MQVTIGLAQTKHPEDGDVIALVERFAAEAHSRGVDMLVFPESLMSRYEKKPKRSFAKRSQSMAHSQRRSIRSRHATGCGWSTP